MKAILGLTVTYTGDLQSICFLPLLAALHIQRNVKECYCKGQGSHLHHR